MVKASVPSYVQYYTRTQFFLAAGTAPAPLDHTLMLRDGSSCKLRLKPAFPGLRFKFWLLANLQISIIASLEHLNISQSDLYLSSPSLTSSSSSQSCVLL